MISYRLLYCGKWKYTSEVIGVLCCCRKTNLISKRKSCESHCCMFLFENNKSFSIFKFFLLNITLFLGGFIFLLITSYIEYYHNRQFLSIFITAIELLYIVLKFDIYKFKVNESFIKLIYILAAIFLIRIFWQYIISW